MNGTLSASNPVVTIHQLSVDDIYLFTLFQLNSFLLVIMLEPIHKLLGSIFG
jgi:hypothetical protein